MSFVSCFFAVPIIIAVCFERLTRIIHEPQGASPGLLLRHKPGTSVLRLTIHFSVNNLDRSNGSAKLLSFDYHRNSKFLAHLHEYAQFAPTFSNRMHSTSPEFPEAVEGPSRPITANGTVRRSRALGECSVGQRR